MRDASVRIGPLQDPATVTRIEIARTVSILPRPASGDVRWTVTVRSPRESAEVFTDRGGTMIGMDLSNTTRMQNLNCLQEPELLPEAAQAFRQVFGKQRIVTRVSLLRRCVGFRTNLQNDTLPIKSTPGGITVVQTFVWQPDGLRRDWGRVMLPADVDPSPAPFAIDDVDWTILPRLVASARDRLGMGEGPLNEAVVNAIPDLAGTPRLMWTVEIADGRETGKVTADLQGRIRNVVLPPSRHGPIDWREPPRLVAALRRIADELPADTAFASISVLKERMEISGRAESLGERPLQLRLTEEGLAQSTFSVIQPPGNKPFRLAELAPLTEERIAALEKRTLDRLGLPTGSITNIAIGRGSMDPSPEGNVTIEIRAEERPFGRGGRINFELDGREIQAYLPDGRSAGIVPLHGDDREACGNVRDLEAMIAGCTRLVEDVTLPARERANAFANRGVAHVGKSEEAAALADLSEAIRIAPGYAHAWSTRGWVHARSGRYREAIDDYTEVLEIQPSDAEAHIKRARAYAAADEWDMALADYNGALQYMHSWNVLHERGALLFDMGDRTRALADLDSALRLPNFASIRFVRGRLHLYNGALDAAARLMRRRADRPSLLRELAAIEGRLPEARQAFTRAAETCPARFIERIGARGELARLK